MGNVATYLPEHVGVADTIYRNLLAQHGLYHVLYGGGNMTERHQADALWEQAKLEAATSALEFWKSEVIRLGGTL